MSNVKYLFVHTAAADIPNVDADKIKGWHLDRGWSDIGYHYVILDDRHDTKADGLVEMGRPVSVQGAHVRGVNATSIGICCAGHGDHRPFTAAQMASLVDLLARLARKHEIDPANVLGHREVNALVDRGDVDERYRTSKSCPGNLIDMDAIRWAVRAKLSSDPDMVPLARFDALRRETEGLRNAVATLRLENDELMARISELEAAAGNDR